MDQQRGRSPSAGHQNSSARQSHSPAPQNYQENLGQNGSGLGLDSSQLDINNQQQQLGNGNYNVNQGIPVYNNYVSPQPDQQYAQNMNFAQNQDFSQPFKQDLNQSFGQQNQPSQSFSQDLLNPNMPSNFNEGDFSLYPSSAGSGEQFDPNYYPNDTSQASSNPSINPADIMSDMSSPPHVHTPPNMLRMDSQQLHSTQHSPAVNPQQYQRSPSHSRHTSLGPESAAFPQAHMHQDWGMMQNHYSGHRRTPSEYSDVSSVAPSPNLINQDSFDNIDSHSPLINAQDSGIYEQPMLGIGNFSLSDNIQNQGMSPGHSPAVSPRLGPQQMPNFNQQNAFMLGMNDNSFTQSNQNMYQNQGPEGFPQMSQMPQMQHANSSGEMGQAQQMIPPEINVEFAPASRQNSFEPPKPFLDQDALTPPERGRRRRAVSDPFNSGSQIARAASPAGLSPGNTSDSSLQGFSPGRSLSPLDRSGASSPLARGRRQSTSSLPNHEYILRLADPDYQAPSGTSESGGTKRVQKHPATFQCTLCPKRFTRAYNLRSHLRTHTDERPFVCTVCGKAFARQHDRKRHEGLHSGEKKFVCKGDLKQGGQWGCGRRFARADALGRHFRSEAGRICIKPLLDEEAIERQRVWHEHQMQNMAQNMQQQQPPMAVDTHGFPIDASGQYTLPAALLAQYPALATLSWSELPAGDAGIEEDISGRSSFDASGSEYYDDGDEAGYVSGPGTGFGPGQMGADGFGGVDYSSDYGGR